jgi:electron transport complex protein RnfC
VVKRNDKVLIGQKIAEANLPHPDGSAPVHSSVSGKVIEVGLFDHPLMKDKSPAIIIDSDGRDNIIPPSTTHEDYYRYTPGELRGAIRDAGVIGMGGAGFPTADKLFSRNEINVLIANGCESEPYLCADEALMTGNAREIVEGMKIVMYILDLYEGIIAVQEDKKTAIEELKKIIFREPNIKVKILKPKYPQGSERQLVKTITGKNIPKDKYPAQEGVLVLNAATLFAVYEAVVRGVPLYRRVVTIAGDLVKDPGNYEVRVGTPARALLDACGYDDPGTDAGQRLIFGGPLEGRAQHSFNVPVLKTTRAVLALRSRVIYAGGPCVRCSRCVDSCPAGLLPNMMSVYAEAGLWENAADYHPEDCIGCGCCSYVCVSARPVTQQVMMARERRVC